jgi:hypothetical protein
MCENVCWCWVSSLLPVHQQLHLQIQTILKIIFCELDASSMAGKAVHEVYFDYAK